ncbi:hypothetical protein [Brevundimonas faecalis]|uniref:Uncharacterized protein n=1 Tax=Brevundimonas faecalis TaxID=947378 RepID=A0ABV2RAW7_9CAUL
MFGFGGRSGKRVLELDRDQALVLFELLSRWIDDAPQPTPSADCFQSPAELVVLKQVDERLKVLLNAPFRPDYPETLAAARDRLSDEFIVGKTLQD